MSQVPEPVANVRGELQSLERVGDTHNIVRLLRWAEWSTAGSIVHTM